MAATPTERTHDPIVRTVSITGEAIKAWGPEWGKPPTAYEFTGRKFELQTEDAGIYSSSPNFNTPNT